ncbi:MAG: outer membrane beta-barrel protein [Burkholderiales bacterium]|nr:outer membrane beta-barrel protein [Burkholderiales bacterium]
MKKNVILAGLIWLALWPWVVLASPADEVRRLVEAGRSAEAYALGRGHPEEFGKPEFDFYFGIAAIDAGHAGEGVLALERYVVQFPENMRARLELARGYFVLGELVRAREEFEAVAAKSPPPAVMANIERFLDAIRAQESRYQTSATAYLEVGAGLDSNVNSGVSGPTINVPTLGDVQLVAAGVKTGDRFLHLGAGGQISRPVAPGVALLFGASYEGKFHGNAFDRQFDLASLAAWGGASWIRDKDLVRGMLSYSTLEVQSDRLRNVAALSGEWHRQLDERSTVSGYAQFAALDYPNQPVRDADFYSLGVGWRRAILHRLQPIVQVQALVGRETNDAVPVRHDLSRRLYTLRASASLVPAPRWALSAGVNYTRSRYREEDALFLARRRDGYAALEVGASYRLSRQLSVRAEYLRAENRSNIALYRYDRDLFGVKLRYEFQ